MYPRFSNWTYTGSSGVLKCKMWVELGEVGSLRNGEVDVGPGTHIVNTGNEHLLHPV